MLLDGSRARTSQRVNDLDCPAPRKEMENVKPGMKNHEIHRMTVAVNVTDWLKFAGLGEAVNAMLVLPCCTTWFSAGEVLELKFESPL